MQKEIIGKERHLKQSVLKVSPGSAVAWKSDLPECDLETLRYYGSGPFVVREVRRVPMGEHWTSEHEFQLLIVRAREQEPVTDLSGGEAHWFCGRWFEEISIFSD